MRLIDDNALTACNGRHRKCSLVAPFYACLLRVVVISKHVQARIIQSVELYDCCVIVSPTGQTLRVLAAYASFTDICLLSNRRNIVKRSSTMSVHFSSTRPAVLDTD